MSLFALDLSDGYVAALALSIAGALGLAVGSFLNVVAWRVPRDESVLHPPSACPACHAPIRRRDNVPVLSWLLLRGRCRDCSARISRRYPLVELATSVVFVVLTLVVGVSWALPAYLYVGALWVVLTLIDLDVRRLPDVIVLPSYGVVAVLLALGSWGEGDWPALWRALVCGAILYAFYFLAMIVYPGGMGLGDVKLAGVLGMALGWLGWGQFAVGAFGAFLLGGFFSIGLMVARRAGRKSTIPFGPWMLGGAALGTVVGAPLWDAYLGLML